MNLIVDEKDLAVMPAPTAGKMSIKASFVKPGYSEVERVFRVVSVKRKEPNTKKNRANALNHQRIR